MSSEHLTRQVAENQAVTYSPSDRALALAVFATHGVLDTAVTIAAFVGLGYFGFERGPIMRPLLESAFWTAHGATLQPLWLTAAPAAAAKLLAVGAAVFLLWHFRDAIPRWRAFTACLAFAGAFVVVTNLLHLLTLTP